MEVKEVKSKRDKLEQDIFELVTRFEKETDAKVFYLHILDTPSLGERQSTIYGIKASISIE